MKRIIIFLVCIILSIVFIAQPVFANGPDNYNITQGIKNIKDYMLGDSDSNGTVDARDANAVIMRICGFDSEIDTSAADLMVDGSINTRDVFYYKSYFAGIAKLSKLETKNSVDRFTIAGTDIAQFVFELPADVTYDDNIYFSYELLYEYIKKACGVDLPMFFGECDSEHKIVFNDVALDSEYGIVLGDEGFKYEVADGNLLIYGTRRGNMYAVYEIIENVLGFSFSSNYETFSYKKRYASLDEGFSRQFVPPLEFRYVGRDFWGSTIRHFYLPRKLNGSWNSPTTGTKYLGTFKGPRLCNAHSFYYYRRMGSGEMPTDNGEMTLAERYAAKLADGYKKNYGDSRFEERGKQPCANSDEDFELVFGGLVDCIRMLVARGYDLYYNEGLTWTSFSINDTDQESTYCNCRTCGAKANGTGKFKGKPEGYSGVYLEFVNRAAREIKKEYPGMKLSYILYDKRVPSTVRPEENVIIFYCSHRCNNHVLGSGECSEEGGSMKFYYGELNGKGYSNSYDEYAIPKWIEYCNDSGATFYYWYYPENYCYYLHDAPCVYNIYYDIKWLYGLGIKGVFYEGTPSKVSFSFEYVKALAAAELMWNPEMSVEEYTAQLKKFMRDYYGKGYEKLYEYLLFLEEAGDRMGCFFNPYDRVWNIFDKQYVSEHYEEMRKLIVEASEEEPTNNNVRCLLAGCEFLGLSACYTDMYVNGTAESRAVYEERYMWFYNFMKDNNYPVYCNSDYQLPKQPDLSKDIATQIYQVTMR